MLLQRNPSDTRVAAATQDRTPRVGIILSSFKGGEDHFGGIKHAALREPKPVNAELTPAQVKEMTRRAIELGNQRNGGLDRIVGRSEWTVLLAARNSDPNVVAAVQDYLRERRRAEKLIVLAHGEPAAADVMEMPAPGIWSRRDVLYRVPKAILHCDCLIAIAPLRLEAGRPSLTIDSYRSFASAPAAAGSRDLAALDILGFHLADYAILGGTQVFRDGRTTRHNLVLAGPIPTAVDAVGAAILGKNPAEVPLLQMAAKRGYGEPDLDVIWMRGNEIDEARVP